MPRSLLVIGAAILLIAACTASGGAASGGAATPSVAAPAPSAASAQPGGGGGVSLPADITDPIVADAATRLGVDPSVVAIVDAHAETWPDGSLGCPEPGMMYTQALVDGYQVIVEAHGTQLDYRGGGTGQFQLCENP